MKQLRVGFDYAPGSNGGDGSPGGAREEVEMPSR